MNPVDVRSRLIDALNVDLIGPAAGSPLESEVLPTAPSRWYLTGFLIPPNAAETQRADVTAEEEVDNVGEQGATDDAVPPEPASARRRYFPSSIGLSLLVSADAGTLRALARWGDYKREVRSAGEGTARLSHAWKRIQREAEVLLKLPNETARAEECDVPGSDGLKIVLSVRSVVKSGGIEGGVPAGTRAVSVFLVNHREPNEKDDYADEAFAFQAQLEVEGDEPFVPRPDVRGLDSDDWDERVADLQYCTTFEFAVGHGVATQADFAAGGSCRRVRTVWIPAAEVDFVAPVAIQNVELHMDKLAELPSAADARRLLSGLADQYAKWIETQSGKIPAGPARRRETGEELIRRARHVAGRIEKGIATLDDPKVLEAFRIANRAMAAAARRREAIQKGKTVDEVDPPKWRPFQLAFILMNLPGVAGPTHPDRDVVDLLFFPTGGGKTEAYFGLSAFTLVYRRLTNPGIASAGLSVLMRYTLRLLTLDQLGRASALICALELERQAAPDKLGSWPFEIGLWVGRAATPNRMGHKGDSDPNSAYRKTIAFRNNSSKPKPIPLEDCPWCGKQFAPASFNLLPKPDHPKDLRVTCVNPRCEFTRGRALPIVAVDEPIYRRLPGFIIATVDKFAAMPWTGPVGAFFGRVDRYDDDGFYGPCDPPGEGRPLPGPLLPPDLVIQDELHLISGPMGTMVGLYETALDELCARDVGEKRVRPKIVASTATVRRADRQVRALFCRKAVDVFPPPGPDRRDSFFARVHSSAETNARLYVGIAAQGRSPKVVMLKAYMALLGAGQRAYEEAGGKRNKENHADPYMTLLGYFNSLRELGGSRRIVEDEVLTRLLSYGLRKRENEAQGLFADRKIKYDVVELTSRVSTDKVAEAKRRLARMFHEDDRVDVALATNMISVGLDIIRLGLMVVFGQPKTSAEYIQATSRVGRDPDRPGLVVTLLNIHKPRDRSHYERFDAYHRSFYRSVEASSVTPFSPRALDRGLAGTLVALSRLGHTPMTPPKGAGKILEERARLEYVAKVLADRAADHARLAKPEADRYRQRVRDRAVDLLDEWEKIANEYANQGASLQYQREVGASPRLLYEFLDPELDQLHPRHQKFRANRSMRDVEPSVCLWLKTLDGMEIEPEED